MDESNQAEGRERQALIIREHRRRSIQRDLLTIGLIALMVAGGIVSALRPSGVIIGLATCAMVPLAAILALGYTIVWRCPGCDGSLGRGDPDFCPNCGVQLR